MSGSSSPRSSRAPLRRSIGIRRSCWTLRASSARRWGSQTDTPACCSSSSDRELPVCPRHSMACQSASASPVASWRSAIQPSVSDPLRWVSRSGIRRSRPGRSARGCGMRWDTSTSSPITTSSRTRTAPRSVIRSISPVRTTAARQRTRSRPSPISRRSTLAARITRLTRPSRFPVRICSTTPCPRTTATACRTRRSTVMPTAMAYSTTATRCSVSTCRNTAAPRGSRTARSPASMLRSPCVIKSRESAAPRPRASSIS